MLTPAPTVIPFFTAKPDLSIFAKNVELHDNSGKRLAGITGQLATTMAQPVTGTS